MSQQIHRFRLGAILTGSNEMQSLRLRRWGMAIVAYAAGVLVYLLSLYQGLIRATGTETAELLLLLVLGNTAFYLLIKHDWNLRLRDPSLTEAQMLFGTLWTFIAQYHAQSMRAEGLMLYVVVFFFGTFRLNLLAYFRVTSFAVFCYLSLIVVEMRNDRSGFELTRELIRLGLLTGEMIGISLLGGHLYRLRREVRDQQIALQNANAIITRQASHDELTELHNRRYLMTALNRECARSMRTGRPFVVALLDLDRFKSINDRFGHLAGDTVLCQFSTCLQQELRRMDLILHGYGKGVLARYGGEEFVLLLPETRAEAGLACLERLAEKVKELCFPQLDPELCLSFSAGLAESRPGEAADSILSRADSALYQAKAEGRDRTILAP